MKLKDIFKLSYHLSCKLLLLEIVTAFDYTANEAKIFSLCQTSILRLFCNFLAHFFVTHLTKETLGLDCDLYWSFCLLFTQETKTATTVGLFGCWCVIFEAVITALVTIR